MIDEFAEEYKIKTAAALQSVIKKKEGAMPS